MMSTGQHEREITLSILFLVTCNAWSVSVARGEENKALLADISDGNYQIIHVALRTSQNTAQARKDCYRT